MKPAPLLVYRRLVAAYGPQGWWPVTPPEGLSPRYRPGHDGPLTEAERCEIAVGAILTQNTAWANVTRALENLHRRNVRSLAALARLSAGALEGLIRPSGYFRQKARKLKILSAHVLSRGMALGRWLSGPLAPLREELLGLWGVGPETADSVLLYAGRRPLFVIDAYTLRIGSRLGWFKGRTSYDEAQHLLTRRLPQSVRLYSEFHALLVALAKFHCLTKPLCRACPLADLCRFGRRLALACLGLLLLSPRSQAGQLLAAAGKVDVTPDPKAERVYLAGYGASGRRARHVHDPLHVRALVVSDGDKTTALVAVDSIGLFRGDVEAMRRDLGWTGDKQYLFVSATHDHSAPDTLGLWGPLPVLSGVSPRYQKRLRDSVVALVRDLAGRLQEAELAAGRAELDPRGLCRDLRDPVVIDPELLTVQLRPRGRPQAPALGTLVRWSCHPEVLGSDNLLITADYPGALCARVEERTGGPCVFMSGVIGGLLSPDAARGEGPEHAFREMERIGRRVGDAAVDSLKGAASRPAGPVAFASRAVRVPVENSRYLLFLPRLTFGHRLLDREGRLLPWWKAYWLPLRHLLFFPLPADSLPWIETEVSRVRIGPVDLLGVPGELLPELAIGGYDGRWRFHYPLSRPTNPDPPDVKKAPRGPYLRQKLGARHGLLVGLANDELGYIIPEYDFKAAPNRAMHPHPPGTHYEETNSIGSSATGILLKAFDELLKP